MAPGGRKNKRNRNKRSNQQRTKNPSDRQQNNPNEESKSTVNSKSQDITEDEDGLIEAKVNGQAVKVTTEVETSPSSHEIGSITKQRETRRRYKLEHRVLNSQPKICEIKNVVGPPLEAIVSCIDHVAGVGILETGFANNTASQSGTIVTEPLEPLEPLPSGVTSRVETLGERYFALAQLPAPGDVNTDGPEIHEVSDSDIETSPVSSNRPALVVEAESDVELPSRSIRQTIVEESEEESSSTRQISLEESDSSDLSLCLQQNTTNNCFNNHSDDEASESTIIDNNTETDTDVEDNVEVGIDGAVEKESSEPARTRETSKGASKCDKLDEDTMDVESSEAMATKKVTVIAHNADSPSEIHEAPLTREVEDKLRIFIKGLDLPSLPKDNLLKDPECHELESCDVVAQKRVKNRAILETYYSESRHVDNFLDIIQEEGEKLSGDEEQHIRDFINGEIGKFCRITRPTGEDNGPGEKPKLTVNEKSKLILENEEDGLKSSFNGEEKVNETNEKELNVSDKPERVPLPPKRSSSLEKKITTTVRLSISSQVESAEVPPEIPALPTESAHSEENNNPPKRPELPAMKTSGTICCNIENQCEEISSKCSTPRLHNSVGEAGRFGNDDASCLEIARGHVNVMAAMRPLKISNHPTGSQRVSEVIPTSVAAIEVESLQPNTGKTTEKTEKNQYSPETRDCADEKIVKESSVTENYQNTKVNKIEEFRSERHEEVSKWLDTVTKSTKFSKTIEEEFNSVESETSESMCYKSSISQVVDGNNKTCVQSKSEKVSESIDLDIVPNRVDSSIVPIIIESSKADQSSSTIDCQTEDSSSSATSSSTVKYVSGGNRIDFTESVTPGKYNNKIRETNGDGSLELTPPPEDHLYYVPLEEQNGLKANKLDSKRPDLLKDLCILKILSMPYGAQIIKEITLPKFNILKNLETSKKTVETLENSREDTDSLLDTMKKRPKSWMGVPTIEDPRLLICLSPSQQEADIRTSADNLLDLHRKFLNRRSYHDDRRREISVPKYHIEVNSMEESGRGFSEHEGKELNQFQHPTAPPNRLLEIIKENPISKDSPGVTNSRKDVGQDRSKVTRLSDWLFSARSKPTDSNLRGEKTQSCEFSGEREPYDENIAAFSPFTERNGHISNSEKILDRGKCQSRFFYDIDGENSSIRKSPNDSSYNVNSALILQSTESLEQRSLSPINKNPITIKSAIIDKTPCYITESRKWAPISSPRGNIDLRHVNSALINDKPEAPPRRRRNVDVDRSCIDTTSIFDKAPPSGHLEARKYEQLCQDPETLKQATANEIIENLKRLQAGSRDVIDGRRRYSLPQEYFDRQMEYIEQLGDQLKEVILAEEEERKAFHDLDSHMNDETLDNHKNSIEESENNNVKRHEESWYEDTRIQEKDETRFSKEEGFRECRKKTITEESKHHIESSTELFENKESSRVISKGESSKDEDKLKWKKFVDDVSEDSKRPKSISIFPTDDEVFRRKMYDEYLREVQEREERKNHKVIKISSYVHSTKSDDRKEDGIMSKMEKEFIERAKNRLDRFGIKLDDSESEKVEKIKSDQTSKIETSTCKQSHHIKEAKCLIDGEEIKDARKLPKHLQEFLQLSTIEADKGYGYGITEKEKTNQADLLHEIDTALRVSKGFLLCQESMFAPTFKASSAKTGVWSPGSEPPPPPRQPSPDRGKNTEKDAGIPTVWTPSSAGASPVVERKEFRPVSFESPVLSRKKRPQTQISTEEVSTPPWKAGDKNETSHNVDHNITTRIVNSHSVPSQGLNTLASTPRLPRAQNPTITLLQKAREGQLPKGAAYLDETDIGKSHEGARISPGEIIYTIKREYESEPETEKDRPKKMADLGRRKVEGIGPITKGGMPVALRSEIKNDNHAKWYKQMYDSLHRAGKDDDYVTIRYKPRRGVRYGYGSSSGYLSEPEPRAYTERSATLDTRRRPRNKENEGSSISTMPRKSVLVKTTAEVYRNQPGRIENYEPGRSSIAEKEPTALAKEQWWDEVMDIFDGAESRQSQLRHPVALRTFIPTHQLVKSMHSIRATSTQSLHPKSSLRTTRAVLEQTDPDAIEVFGTTSRENHQPAVKFGAEPPTVSILLGRTNSTLNTDRVSYSMIKSPKCDRIATSRSRRHSRTSSRDSHSDDSMVVGFIDETIRQMDQEPDNWNSATLDERSKSFVLLNNNNSSSSRRSSPLIGNRSSPSNKDRSFLPMTSPRNHHRNHHHNQRQQHHDPSISSSTSSSSSSTIHITMLPPPPPITTSVIAESALTSPPRPFDQHNSHTPKPYMSHALKESGYESDSTLIFRRRDDVSPLSPLEQRLAYKTVQKGGDVPLHGFRKPAPERPKDDAEIEYFPISPTLTRLRLLRRRNGISSTAASMSSMTFARYKKTPSSSSSAAATIVPHQRVNSTEVITNRSEIVPRDLRVPSPPRRRSSRHNATLKFYASSGSTHPPNPRHEQCFAADSASNIRFLRERLSNKLLKHEQGRVSELTRRNLTSSRSSPIRLSSPTKVKLPTKTISVLPKRKIESTPVKSLTGPDKTIESRITKSAVEFKQRSSEEKPPIGRVNTKVSLSTDTSIRSTTTRTKTLPSCQKKYQAKVRNSRKETDESLKRHSSTDLSLAQAEVGRVLHGRRQVNVGNSLTGSNVKTNSSLLRVKSQDIALTKVISSSRESRKTRTVTSPLRSSSPALSISPCRRTTVNEISKQRTFPGKSREKLTTFVTSTIVCGDLSISKRIRDKPQTLVKSPTKKYETIESEEKDKRKKNTSKKEKTRETIKSKKLFNGKSDLERKKVKKVAGKSEIASKRDTISVTGETTLTMERIKKHQEATRTDSFFQNLFLRNIPSPATSQCSTLKRSSVMEQARIFQEFGNEGYRSEPSLRSLNIYLATKRPVSNSRFKNWERESISSRSSSPFGASWHGRSIFQKITKFDSLHGMDEFGSLTSLRGRSPDLEKKAVKERSLSEPPLRLSLTSDDQNKIPPSSSRSSSPTTGKSAACRRIRGLKQEKQDFPILKTRARSASEADDSERRRITFGSNLSLTKSTSSLESPPTNREDYQRYVFEMLHSQKKSGRYKDLHDFYASLERMGRLEKTTSSSELRPRLKNEEIIDYDRWKDIRSMERAEQELKVLYGKLKAVQRDKDFLFSTKDVENLRWRGDIGLRCRERSVENIRESFKRLAKGESELESTRRREIASKKDVYKPLWRGSSVVNVANSITKKANDEKNLDENDKWSVQPSLQKSLGGSKKFWSSLSIEQVNALKNQLNEIYGSDNNGKCKSTNQISEDKSINQLDKIQQIQESRITKSDYEVIVPPQQEFGDGLPDSGGLSVRCHSMLVQDIKLSTSGTSSLQRSGSICRGRYLDRSKSDKSSVLTESDKKRISQTLGKEILNKVSQQKRSPSPVAPRETRGAIAAASTIPKSRTGFTNTSPRTCYSLETPLDSETHKSRDKSDILLVLTPMDETSINRKKVESVLDEWSKKPSLLSLAVTPNTPNKNASGSEVDSATESSENSVKTVVQREKDAEDVLRKVEFFERIERENKETTVDKKKKSCRLSASQSVADLKELFGETESARFATLPFRSSPGSRVCSGSPGSDIETKRRSISASPDVPYGRFSTSARINLDRPRSVSPCRVSTSTCSIDSPRHRSASPDPERYWRAYLNLVKHGSVRKLRAKFESLEELSGDRIKLIPTPKRFQSDPELTRNLLKTSTDEKKTYFKTQEIPDVAWLRRKYEPVRGRAKKRLSRSPTIPRIPLRLEDLSMPHINVISKTIELKDSVMSRSSSTNSLAIKAETEELEAKRPVGRIREKFEKLENLERTSILGEMFTSAPDVHELRDISPYLAGGWVAHKYPSRRDNSRSISLPPELRNKRDEKYIVGELSGRSTLPKRHEKIKEYRGVSTSPMRPRTPTSILKQPQTDPFANQVFDASKHRPKYRYQPPPPPPPLPAPSTIANRRQIRRSWWPPIATYTARPTVTFEEYTNAPPPPPKSHHCRTERQESPRRYVEGEVTIHYRSPVRTEAKEILSEEELARRSAENMRRVYQEERRRKYLQELHDIDSRRHTDNFVPSQKSPIPLNRYDDFLDDLSYRSRSQEQTPEPRLVARAMYNFVGQTSKELSFRRGDIILVRRQIDKNWYEGEHNAMIGLFPINYVEILPYDSARSTPKKSYEGQARAKFNFLAQTNLELSLAKGELVVLTRRVDENWYEGRIGNKKGIFPVTYVEVLVDPGQQRPETPVSSKPVASPAAHSMLSNGTASGKMSMGPHHYTPSIPVKTSTTEPQYISLPRIGVTDRNKLHVAPVNETLHIDTHSDTIPYRALYNYRPQNEDELELKEGDTVYVMEKCDDGWFVGSSQRTGYFGTFPGNYVERL